MSYLVTSECQKCGACAAACESEAIKEDSDKYTIDVTLCIECGICVSSCPFEAIIIQEEVPAQ